MDRPQFSSLVCIPFALHYFRSRLTLPLCNEDKSYNEKASTKSAEERESPLSTTESKNSPLLEKHVIINLSEMISVISIESTTTNEPQLILKTASKENKQSNVPPPPFYSPPPSASPIKINLALKHSIYNKTAYNILKKKMKINYQRPN